ncbi:MAG TPA: lipid II flippase MurJ [Terriglobales bacterium]|nr:lipid II flippase MurJ [Terriglobales bacterium]
MSRQLGGRGPQRACGARPASGAAERFPLGFWALTTLARAASAAKEVALAMVLGTSPFKDALVVAWTAPTLLATYCNETLPALLTPLWAQPAGGNAAGARRLVGLALAALALLGLAALLWPAAVIAVVAPALPPATAALATTLERWLAANIFLLGAQSLLAARLNAARRFRWAPLAAGLPAAAVLGALGLTRGWALAPRLDAIAAGLTLGSALGLALLLLALFHRPAAAAAPLPAGRAPAPPPRPAPLRPFGALLLAMLVLNLVPLAERMAASGLHPGSLAAYDYGERLVLFVFGLSVAPFTAVSFTRLAELAGADAFAPELERALQGLVTAAMPLAAGLAVFAPLITRCVYGWGRFHAASLAATAPVVAIRGAGLGLDAVFYYLLFALYARGRAATKLPLALALAAVNLPLAFVAARAWGVAGLAGAHLAAYAAALAWLLRQRGALLPGVRWRAAAAAAGQSGALTLAVALGVRRLLPPAAVAGALGGAASWAWMALAVALTALGAALLARWLAPALLPGLRLALWPPRPAAPRLEQGARLEEGAA